MRHAFLLSFLGSCALAGAAPAMAQEAAEEDKAALSGGFDFIELRAGEGDEIFLWDGSFSYGDSTDQIMLMVEGGGAAQSDRRCAGATALRPVDQRQCRAAGRRTA
ncbi:hypothetical protein [Sphingobium bisphenolivorans]|uniref:hypothetical protein n=1 Tax=Sphingobium bisphenolivorans TaxID=1335760 RepID=UPI00187C99ED|nr:hypothetical protein [Sphingobium bisphenolivorans]